MSILHLESRMTGLLALMLGSASAWAAEEGLRTTTAPPAGGKVIVSTEPVMDVVLGGALNHPLLAGIALIAGIAFVILLIRHRQAVEQAPDQPQPPAVPSAWPQSFKPVAATGHFPKQEGVGAEASVALRRAAMQLVPASAELVPADLAKAAFNMPAKATAAADPSGAMMFDWPGGGADSAAASPISEAGAGAVRVSTLSAKPVERPTTALSSLQLRLRDRYISVRFPGVAKCSQDLEASSQVIKAARLYFEDEQANRSVELLELAIEQHPEEESLWLALIEILFLVHQRNEFCKAAARFKVQHPHSAQWPEVTRLGAVIAGDNLMFRSAAADARAHEHYGPWPDLPNWIQAPWDLTAEVSAADFHAHLNQRLLARRVCLMPLARAA